MILGGAAIGGALGLLGRYHDNKVKHEYERGYKVGYQLGYQLDKSVYSKDDENIFTIDIRRDYNFKFGNHLFGAQRIQSAATRCYIGIFYKRDDFLKLVIRSGVHNEKYNTFTLERSNSDEFNEELFKQFINTYIEIENDK